MRTLKKDTARLLIVCIVFLLLPGNLHAWQPNAKDLGAAINAGDFTAYVSNLSAWLNKKMPADLGSISKAGMEGLLKDPAFAKALGQHQFLSRYGVAKIGAFAKADQANRTFLVWLLPNTHALDLCLEGSGGAGSLDTWTKIFTADPDSKEGLYLRLAIAASFSGSPAKSYGSGVVIDPVERYKHYKAAHKNKELFPSFDDLSVWELGNVLTSWASDRDLAWVRQMINTWRPDLRKNEQVVNIVSEVWRRFSPFPFSNGFITVMEGGGKCGPRSWFGEMTCKAFGLPAQAMGQRAHSAVAYKSPYPQVEPQPGSAWKICYGGGWHKTFGGYGLLAEAAARDCVGEFSLIQHLKWLAATLTSKEQADAVTGIVSKLQAAMPKPGTGPNPAVGPDSKPTAIAKPPVEPPAPEIVPEKPFEPVPGVIHIEAETFTKSYSDPNFPEQQKGEVWVLDCFTGGKQVNFQKNMTTTWIEYVIDVPEAGEYGLTMRVAAANRGQVLYISSLGSKLATIKLPSTHGLWETTDEVRIKFEKGAKNLRISAPFQRGIAIRWFELKAK